MDHYDDWFWKTYVLPVAEIALIYGIFGHIDLYLTFSKSKAYDKLAIRENASLNPTYKNLMINLIINFAVIIILGYLLLQISPTHIPLSTFYERNMKEVILKFFDAIVIEQFYFYFAHRVCHTGKLYENVHYLHHQATLPYALTTVYCTVSELLFITVPTITLGVIITQMSWYLACIRYAYITVLTMLHHTGHYLLFDPSHHDHHHLTRKGNYGFMEAIDKMFGTYIDKNGMKHEINISYWMVFGGLMLIRFYFI